MRRPVAFTLVAAFLWGTTFPGIDYGLSEGGAGPFTFAALRFIIATLTIWIAAALMGRVDPRLFRSRQLWLLSLLNALGYATQFAAQDLTTASKTSLLVDIDVVAVAILGYYFLNERHGREIGIALGLGLVGVLLLSTNGNLETVRFSNAEFVGDLLAFIAGLVWAAYFVALKRFLQREPDTHGVSLTVAVFTVTTLLLVPLGWFTERLTEVGSPSAIAMAAYLGIFPTTVAFLLWQDALRHVAATVSALILLLEIVVALSLSAIFLGEQLNPWGWAGAVLIIAAAYLASIAPSSPPASLTPQRDDALP